MDTATTTRVLPRPENWYPVGSPSSVQRYDWEPGDMTRYEFVVAYNVQGYDLFSWTNLLAGGRSMWLPHDWREYSLDPSYIAGKMELNQYNAERVAQFLDLLRATQTVVAQ